MRLEGRAHTAAALAVVPSWTPSGYRVDTENLLLSARVCASRDEDEVIVEVDPVDHDDLWVGERDALGIPCS